MTRSRGFWLTLQLAAIAVGIWAAVWLFGVATR
jgi:hypothetical protein